MQARRSAKKTTKKSEARTPGATASAQTATRTAPVPESDAAEISVLDRAHNVGGPVERQDCTECDGSGCSWCQERELCSWCGATGDLLELPCPRCLYVIGSSARPLLSTERFDGAYRDQPAPELQEEPAASRTSKPRYARGDSNQEALLRLLSDAAVMLLRAEDGGSGYAPTKTPPSLAEMRAARRAINTVAVAFGAPGDARDGTSWPPGIALDDPEVARDCMRRLVWAMRPDALYERVAEACEKLRGVLQEHARRTTIARRLGDEAQSETAHRRAMVSGHDSFPWFTYRHIGRELAVLDSRFDWWCGGSKTSPRGAPDRQEKLRKLFDSYDPRARGKPGKRGVESVLAEMAVVCGAFDFCVNEQTTIGDVTNKIGKAWRRPREGGEEAPAPGNVRMDGA